MQFIAAVRTLHSADMIAVYLRHMENIGATGVIVADLGSEDGTLAVLNSERWAGFVHLLPQISMVDADHDTGRILLDAAKSRFAGLWCLFVDPDELVSPTIRDLTPAREVSCYQLPRRNVTARREFLDRAGAVKWCDLRLEIVQSIERTAAGPTDRLMPPWIHSRVLDKVLVRLDDTLEIGQGDHVALTRSGRSVAAENVTIRHYPIRSYAAFLVKVRTIETYLAHNPELPPTWAWHWRRWVRIMQAGELYNEYLAQFPDAAETDRMLASGAIREIEPCEAGDQTSMTNGSG